MKVYTYDRSERGLAMARRLNDKPPPGAESIRLFPIPTTKDGVTVNGGDMRISDGLRELGDGELVIGYGIPEDIRNKLTRAGVSVADSAEDEEFLVANAHLTALGALGKILTGWKRAPGDMSIGILGYGRIGSALCRLLIPICPRITVYTTDPDKQRELGSYGIHAPMVGQWESLGGLDLLINTAPAPLLDGVERPEGLRVMDLASGNYLAGWGEIEKYPSIPAVCYPESAGEIWYRSVLRLI